MPEKDENKRTVIPSSIRKLANTVQDNLNGLYARTYFSSPNNKNDLEITKSKINKTLDDIISNNKNNTGSTSVASLYTRLDNYQKDPDVARKISTLFEDRNLMTGLMSAYIENKYLKDYDNEIDTVLKYCPKLKEALEVRKDNVLSADFFSKDYLIISDETNVRDDAIFMKRCGDIKEIYNLIERVDEWYDTTAMYGEVFVYIVPYAKAISRLLVLKNGNTNVSLSEAVLNENFDDMEQFKQIETKTLVINEATLDSEHKASFNALKKVYGLDSTKTNLDFKLEFNMTNMLFEDVIEKAKAFQRRLKASKSSLSEAFLNEASIKRKKDTPVFVDGKRTVRMDIDKGIMGTKDKPKDLDYSEFTKDTTSREGLIDTDNWNKTIEDQAKDMKLKVTGAILKNLERYNVIPIYIDDLCLGYYYLEFKENDQYTLNTQLADPVMTLKANTKLYNDAEKARADELLRYISARLSKEIDAKFVNINQDLTKEIYMILKHNYDFNTPNPEGIRVTFIPPDDMEHIVFRRDPHTHRGVSDLERSMLPGKLYAGLYITNTIAAMTRSQDRRVYYVKQAVDTNISEVLLNVIDQIKKSNFNIRQIENINQVLNIVGKFNDFVIPTNANGESPVQFEVMQGQDVDPQTELMSQLLEMAVNNIDVPLELIQARQSIDYAVQFTMSNSKFLRKVFNRQAKFQPYLSRIFSKLYNYQYEESAFIRISLPPPAFLSITNTDQLSNNIVNLSQTITDIAIPPNQEDPTSEVKRNILLTKVKRDYLKTYVDFDRIDKFVKETEQEVALTQQSNSDNQEQQ